MPGGLARKQLYDNFVPEAKGEPFGTVREQQRRWVWLVSRSNPLVLKSVAPRRLSWIFSSGARPLTLAFYF
jgi:hypothetical protein